MKSKRIALASAALALVIAVPASAQYGAPPAYPAPVAAAPATPAAPALPAPIATTAVDEAQLAEAEAADAEAFEEEDAPMTAEERKAAVEDCAASRRRSIRRCTSKDLECRAGASSRYRACVEALQG
jgi:hypothetical protein